MILSPFGDKKSPLFQLPLSLRPHYALSCTGTSNLNPEPKMNLNHANLRPQNLWAVVSQEFAAAD